MGRIKNNISPSTLGLFEIIEEEKDKLKQESQKLVKFRNELEKKLNDIVIK